ncbi:rCG28842 [Rattus norvegicus]|uniref:RCG28842 n=1 Tax=Rattus norvegicus TaxID=10116 RepID=A6HW84_RAT|nr:rCG28842 [Rattus norvegicus]
MDYNSIHIPLATDQDVELSSSSTTSACTLSCFPP